MSSKYFDKLKTFMNNYKSSDKYTHLSYGDFTGKFNIPFDKSKEFIKMIRFMYLKRYKITIIYIFM